MSLFVFKIDDVVINEPFGWADAKRRLVRNTKYRMLFLEYIIDLTFEKEAYDMIKDLILAQGYCGEITFQVFKRANDLSDLLLHFEGKLILDNVREDETKCQITVDVVDNSFADTLIKQSDIVVPFNATRTIGGLSNTLTSRIVAVYRQHPTDAAWHNRTFYYIFDIFQFILNYISNNQITLVSNLFSAYTNAFPSYISADPNGVFRLYQSVTFTNPGVELVSPGNVVISWEIMGMPYVYTMAKGATVADTLNILMFVFNNTNMCLCTNSKTNYYNHIHDSAAFAITNGTNNLEIYSDFKIKIISITGAANVIVNADIPESPDLYGYSGLNNLYKLGLTTVNGLRGGSASIPSISFNELFTEINKFENIGLSLSKINGVATLRLEQISYFQQESEALELQNVPSINMNIYRQYLFNSITFGEGSDHISEDTLISQISKDVTFISSDSCIGESIDLRSKYYTDWDDIIGLMVHGSDNRDNINNIPSLVLMEFVDTVQPGCDAESKLYRYRYEQGIPAYHIAFVLNVKLNNFSRARNWVVSVLGDLTMSMYSFNPYIINNYDNSKIKSYSIEYPLTDEQYKLIIDNMLNYIAFNKGIDPGTKHRGWILDVTREEVSGKTTLKLLS